MSEIPNSYEAAWLNLPLAESPFREELLAASSLDEASKEEVRTFARDGYLVLDDLGIDDLDARMDRIVRDLADRYEDPNRRVLDGWTEQEDVRKLAVSEPILNKLRMLYGRAPIPFQTLNFDVGTEQKGHSDIIHFNSVPRRFVCGVWVAFEEMDADNGPLFYYPGSHLLSEFQMVDLGLPGHADAYPAYEGFIEKLIAAQGLEKEEVRLSRGQALIWSANLIHGGCPVSDPARTRHSQVTHYFFEDCAYYISLLSDFPVRIHAREVFDLRRLRLVPHRLGGHEIDLDGLTDVWRYPRPLPTLADRA